MKAKTNCVFVDDKITYIEASWEDSKESGTCETMKQVGKR